MRVMFLSHASHNAFFHLCQNTKPHLHSRWTSSGTASGFVWKLAARESTPPKRNCVANLAPVKVCCVIAVENLSLF